MVERIFNLYLEGNEKEGKKFVEENYDELGELVYAITVNNEYMEGPDGLNAYAGFIKFLSNCGHKLDFVDGNGNSALHGAVNGQDPIMVVAFLERTELFTLANNDGITPIMLGFTKENEEIKDVLAMNIGDSVNDIINVNGEDMTYATLAIYTSSPKVLAAVLSNENFDYEIHKPYLDEVEWEEDDEDDIERQNLIENYLTRSNDFDDEDNEEDNFDLDTENDSLYQCVIEQDVKTIKQNLEKFDVEEERAGYTALNLAISLQNEEMVDVLLQKANVNHRTTSGITPLLSAVVKGNVSLVERLISMGAYLNAPLYNGYEPIFYAVGNNNKEIVKILLDNNVYISSYNMNVILEKFDDTEHSECIKLLKEYKNPIKVENKYPYEEKYELGYNPTLEDDGYHGVKWVLNTTYGSRMINSDGANGIFAIPGSSIVDVEIKEKCTKVVAAPFIVANSLGADNVIGFLTEKGKVLAYNIDTNEEIKEVSEWEDIVDVATTNFNLIGLTKDGVIKVYQPEFYEFYDEVKSWKNIVKISTGFNVVYAIDKDNNFYYAGSDVALTEMMGDASKVLQDIKKAKAVYSGDFSAVIIDDDDNIIPVNVSNDIKFVEGIKDIAFSLMHVVVLKKDGTLVAFGNNDLCQCNISKWHDIVRIQANNYCTIGYASDGEILCTENMGEGTMLKPHWIPGFGNMISSSVDYVRNIMNL